MSATLMEKSKSDFVTQLPDLKLSSWYIFAFNGAKIEGTGCTWQFKKDDKVHDNPEVWEGNWEKISEDKIRIDAIWKSSSIEKYFELIFVTPKYFIALENNNIVFSGSRI